MIDLEKYWHLNGKQIKVTCTDGQIIYGKWIDWTSAQDNEPDPESITVLQVDEAPVEIYIDEIKDIQKAS